MTVEIFLVVVLMLVVKYTIEFADRTSAPTWRRVRRLVRRPPTRRPPPPVVPGRASAADQQPTTVPGIGQNGQ